MFGFRFLPFIRCWMFIFQNNLALMGLTPLPHPADHAEAPARQFQGVGLGKGPLKNSEPGLGGPGKGGLNHEEDEIIRRQ